MNALLLSSLLLNALLLAVLLFRPDLAARLRGSAVGAAAAAPPPRLAGLAEALDTFATHYFLWLISARVAMWTAEPEDLRHAEEMIEAGRGGLRRAAEALGEWRVAAPRAAQSLIDELLQMSEVDGVTPTAEVFNRKAEGVRLLVDRTKAAISA